MLQEFLTYTAIADGKLIEIFDTHQNLNPKAISLFSHVLNAQYIWGCRILEKQPDYAVWQEFSPTEFALISSENFKRFEFILTHIPLDKAIHYSNSKGDTYVNTVNDILFHAFNHSTYHRAQISTLFKLDNIKPPVTDYIILKRDHLL
jgi:uncharacterized damage-inducible protein DinB